MLRKRQATFAMETKQATDNVITQMHRLQSQNVRYGVQMQCMQEQMRMQMRMQMQNPVLDTTTVQVPSTTLDPII